MNDDRRKALSATVNTVLEQMLEDKHHMEKKMAPFSKKHQPMDTATDSGLVDVDFALKSQLDDLLET